MYEKFLKYHTNIYWNISIPSRQRISFQTNNWKRNLYKTSKDKGGSLVNFATLKNLIAKGMIVHNRNIHKFSWT
jgi:hypothetical protein